MSEFLEQSGQSGSDGTGHLRDHMKEMEAFLGRRGRWAYLAWVVAWAAALVFMAVTFL